MLATQFSHLDASAPCAIIAVAVRHALGRRNILPIPRATRRNSGSDAGDCMYESIAIVSTETPVLAGERRESPPRFAGQISAGP